MPSWGTEEWFVNKFQTQGVDHPGAYFAHAANGYQRYRHGKIIEEIRKRVLRDMRGAMLDVGCGTGDLTARLAAEFPFDEVYGIDFVRPAIDYAGRRFPSIRFETAQLPRLRYPAESFNVVTASEVLYYLDCSTRKQTVGEFARILKPDGVLIFSSAVGRDYFTEIRARRLLCEDLKIEAVWHDYSKLYHILTAPLNLLNSLYFAVYCGSRGTSERLSRIIGNHQKLLNSWPIRQSLALAQWFAQKVLSSESLAWGCSLVPSRLGMRWAISNVCIIARKAPKNTE